MSKPVTTAISVEQLPGDLYRVALHTLQDGKVLKTEYPAGPHIWGQVKFEFEQQSVDRIFPKGME